MSTDQIIHYRSANFWRRANPVWLVKMAWRDSRTHRGRLLLFVSSISIGIAALVAMNTLKNTMEHNIDAQANVLLGADLSVSSNQPFTEVVEELFSNLGGQRSRQVRFSSVVFFPAADRMRLVQVRTQDGDFPYYGKLTTDPPAAAAAFTEGQNALVDHNLMLQFETEVGDSVKVGALTFRIAGRLLKIPGETAAAGNLEPRVYVPGAYLEETRLVQRGSRVSHRMYFKFAEDENVTALLERMQPQFKEHHLDYETVASRKRNIGRPLRNLYRFLNLGSFVALLLGSVGVASAIHAYVRQKLNTIAVLRSLGATTGQTMGIYLLQASFMGLVGVAAGALMGTGVASFLPDVIGDLLPVEVEFTLATMSYAPLIQGLYVGLGMTVLFALLPLVSIRRVSPLIALRFSFEESALLKKEPLRWVLYLLIVGAITAFAMTQTRTWTRGLGFAVGVFLAFGLLTLVARGLIYSVRRFFPAFWSYVWRQGLANLYRPNNQTVMLLLALGLGTFLISTLYLTQYGLLDNIDEITSGDQPNMVLIDIQTDQQEELATLIGQHEVQLIDQVPIVAMRLQSIKGRAVKEIIEDRKSKVRRWTLRREYRTTYRDYLSNTETVVSGQWQGTAGDTVYISIDHSIAADLQVQIGDEMVFDVQGVPIATVIGSMRSVNWQRIRPNFLVLFPAGVLEEAPQFHVFVLRSASAAASAALQRAIMDPFPNVSAIDLQLILDTVNTLLDKVTLVIRFMALFSVVTGLLVLLGVITSSRYQRIEESVLLRTLGAVRSQVVKIMTLEYFFLGFLAAFTGLGLAVVGTWALTHFVFNIPFVLPFLPLVLVLVVVSGLTVVVGLLSSRGIHDSPPLEVLRSVG